MKNTILLLCMSFIVSAAMATEADSTGLEGDNLDLNAVLELFKDSESPEDFEKKLNSEGSDVNNLDLNEDGEVDYIRVIDAGDSTSHVLTLQVPVTESESQDIAVIEMEKTAEETVNVQVVGDAELYGENYILVPQATTNSVVMVNAHAWRPVRFMFAPKYVFYASPWRYRHHPKWYRPWKRVHWNVYNGRVNRHRGHCRRIPTRHFHNAHHHYHHTHSAHFHNSHHHKHGKVAGKTTPGGKAPASGGKAAPGKGSAGKTAPASPAAKPGTPKKQTAPAKSSASPKESPAPNKANERKRPGAHSEPSKTRSKGTSGKKKSTPNRQSSGKKSGGNSGGKRH
ncbi:MAG: hypothetical protein ACJAUD_001500 [Crocinitomicaceae bacterium]|jgi:hypothetical protein